MKSGKWRQWVFALAAMGALMGLRYGYDHLMRKESRAADAVEAFAREGLERPTVSVYAINSLQNEMLAEADSDRNLEVGEFYARVTAEHFHQYPIRKMVTVEDERLAQRVVGSVVKGIRRKASGAKCFEPHHAVRITRGTRHVDVVICYSCELVQVWGIDPAGKWQTTVYDTTSDGSRKVLEKAMRAEKWE